MAELKPMLTLSIPVEDPEKYKKELELALRQLIVASIDRERAGYRYHKAVLLFPVWLELNPSERMVELVRKILEDHLRDAQENVTEMLKLLKVDNE